MSCQSTNVAWEEPRSVPGDTLGALAVSADGSVDFVRPPTAPSFPEDSAGCATSMAVSTDSGRWYATWLRRRPDSTVLVVAARSDDGRNWTKAAIVDSVDLGKHGCSRPGPSIATAGGYVHIAYSLAAPEGTGVFFAHSMDQGATFHSPATVIYGDRLSVTGTAAHGMRVAVAYEDPSGAGHRIDVALSKTQGHTFEPRERGSPDEMSAVAPRIAIRDQKVALSFAGAGGIGRALRVGHIR
jgi:hypothetical protein